MVRLVVFCFMCCCGLFGNVPEKGVRIFRQINYNVFV